MAPPPSNDATTGTWPSWLAKNSAVVPPCRLCMHHGDTATNRTAARHQGSHKADADATPPLCTGPGTPQRESGQAELGYVTAVNTTSRGTTSQQSPRVRKRSTTAHVQADRSHQPRGDLKLTCRAWFTFAPVANSSLTTSSLPAILAACSGVVPSLWKQPQPSAHRTE